MNRLFVLVTTCLLVTYPAISALSQTTGSLVGQFEARQLGLQRMWFAQVDVDVGHGGLLHLTQHVSSTKSVTIYQVHYDGGRVVISERDVDRFGTVIGPENAKKAASIKFNDFTNLRLNPKIETTTLPQITLYGVTDAGVVQAIDSETGRTLWKAGIGQPGAPIEAVGVSDLYAAVVSASDLYLLKADTGEMVWKRRVIGAPGAGPAITSHLVFVPMVSGAMEAYPIDDTKSPPMIYRSQGRAMWQPVYTGANVAWPTDRGHLYVTGAVQNRINFRLEANDAIAAPATVMSPGKLVVSSVDGFVYCLQEASGVVLWRFSSGEPMLDSPIVYGDSVYVVTSDGNLFAIDGQLGQERWSAAGIAKIVGASVSRLYCLNGTGGLIILDKQNGSRIGALDTHSIDVPFVNKETDRLVLANRRGMIQCLREIQNEFPVIHVSLATPEESAQKTPAKTPKPAEAAPADPGDNPFGETAPAAEEKPAAKDEKKVDDPFGE
jgi:outer membrane protein assembly factor BamB